MATAEGHRSNIGRYLTVYVVMLVIAALQFGAAYTSASTSHMLTRMLILAVIEAALALLYFMHLSDNRGLLWFVLIFTVFVLLAMQYGWTDSFRISNGVPWAK
jgi:caa(3)-type oxidase subunit IV